MISNKYYFISQLALTNIDICIIIYIMRKFLFIFNKKIERWIDKHPIIYLIINGSFSLMCGINSIILKRYILATLSFIYFIWITTTTIIELNNHK